MIPPLMRRSFCKCPLKRFTSYFSAEFPSGFYESLGLGFVGSL
jgi:hypothetical protein